MNTMDYVNTATTRTLSLHILPIADLKQMLSHIEGTLPPTMHLPVSSEDTLHFYRYLHTHILIANRQFLLPIDIPIQDKHTKNFQSTKFLPLIFLIEISQHNMMSIVIILESHRTKLWQWKFHNTSSAYVKKLMDNFAILMQLCNHLLTLHLASQPYMPQMQPVPPLDALYKSGKLKESAYPPQLFHMYGY